MKPSGLIGFVQDFRWPLAMLALLTGINALVMLTLPWVGGQLLGALVSDGGSPGRLGAVLISALLATTLLTAFVSFRSAKTAADILAAVRQRAFNHVQQLPIGFHESRGKGDMLALLTYELVRLSYFLTNTVTSLPAKLLTTVGAVLLMFRLEARLAILVPALIPIFYLILKIVGRRLRSLAASIQQAEARVVAISEEMLEMLPATKAFTQERSQSEKYRQAVDEAAALRVREARIYAWLEPTVGFIAGLAAVLTLLLAGRSLAGGGMSPAQLFSFIFYAALLTRPISSLANIYGEVQTARGTLARLQSVLDQPIEEVAADQAGAGRFSGAIAFTDVCFAYPGRDPLLKNLSFNIDPGQTVAIIGPNGAGKTAIINLLLRYYDRDGGRITLDGFDIADLDVATVRRQIGLVPQMPMLFNASIAENIAFGGNAPGKRQIDEAAELAQAADFIAELPHGMDTVIGDRGVRLSGGQRQRIALARALIKDPPILIFDEATSMFDDEGEQAFIAQSAKALRGRTVIIVTHRPATLALADRVLVLDDGVVRERSTGSEA